MIENFGTLKPTPCGPDGVNPILAHKIKNRDEQEKNNKGISWTRKYILYKSHINKKPNGNHRPI